MEELKVPLLHSQNDEKDGNEQQMIQIELPLLKNEEEIQEPVIVADDIFMKAQELKYEQHLKQLITIHEVNEGTDNENTYVTLKRILTDQELIVIRDVRGYDCYWKARRFNEHLQIYVTEDLRQFITIKEVEQGSGDGQQQVTLKRIFTDRELEVIRYVHGDAIFKKAQDSNQELEAEQRKDLLQLVTIKTVNKGTDNENKYVTLKRIFSDEELRVIDDAYGDDVFWKAKESNETLKFYVREDLEQLITINKVDEGTSNEMQQVSLKRIFEEEELDALREMHGEEIYEQAKLWSNIKEAEEKIARYKLLSFHIDILKEKKIQFLCRNAFIFFVFLPILILGCHMIFKPPMTPHILDPNLARITLDPGLHQMDNLTIIKQGIYYNHVEMGNGLYLNVTKVPLSKSLYRNARWPIGIALGAESNQIWKNIQISSFSRKNKYTGQLWFSKDYKDALGHTSAEDNLINYFAFLVGYNRTANSYIHLNNLIQYATGIEYLFLNASSNNLTFTLNVIQIHQIMNRWWMSYFMSSFIAGGIVCYLAYRKTKYEKPDFSKISKLKVVAVLYEIFEVSKDFYYMFMFPRVNYVTLSLLIFAMIFHIVMVLFTLNMVSCLQEENPFKVMFFGLSEDAQFQNSQRKFYQTFGGSLVHLGITLFEAFYFGYKWPWYLYLMNLVSSMSICYNIGQRLGQTELLLKRKVLVKKMLGEEFDEEKMKVKYSCKIICSLCISIFLVVYAVGKAQIKFFVWNQPILRTYFLNVYNPFIGGGILWWIIPAVSLLGTILYVGMNRCLLSVFLGSMIYNAYLYSSFKQ